MAHNQHFLLSAKARTLSVLQVMQMSDAEAFEVFKEIRWGAGEEVACPVCGTIGKHYFQRTRRQWRCKDWNHTFSVTSGAIFAFLNNLLPYNYKVTSCAILFAPILA